MVLIQFLLCQLFYSLLVRDHFKSSYCFSDLLIGKSLGYLCLARLRY